MNVLYWARGESDSCLVAPHFLSIVSLDYKIQVGFRLWMQGHWKSMRIFRPWTFLQNHCLGFTYFEDFLHGKSSQLATCFTQRTESKVTSDWSFEVNEAWPIYPRDWYGPKHLWDKVFVPQLTCIHHLTLPGILWSKVNMLGVLEVPSPHHHDFFSFW